MPTLFWLDYPFRGRTAIQNNHTILVEVIQAFLNEFSENPFVYYFSRGRAQGYALLTCKKDVYHFSLRTWNNEHLLLYSLIRKEETQRTVLRRFAPGTYATQIGLAICAWPSDRCTIEASKTRRTAMVMKEESNIWLK